MEITTLTRYYSMPALHTLQGTGFSAVENLEVFGPCSRLHGHDYRIEVTVTGSIDRLSGLMISRQDLDAVVNRVLIDKYSGTNLSDHFAHTTGEGLAIAFFELIQKELPDRLRLVCLKVHETAKNSFTAGDSC